MGCIMCKSTKRSSSIERSSYNSILPSNSFSIDVKTGNDLAEEIFTKARKQSNDFPETPMVTNLRTNSTKVYEENFKMKNEVFTIRYIESFD